MPPASIWTPWAPRAGVAANTTNLERSYDRYLAFQRDHRELQWAGMGRLSGADFGGGLLDMDIMATVYRINGVQPLAQQIVAGIRDAAGQDAVDQLPSALRALATMPELTSSDMDYIIGEILGMQKAIFCDLMPMHQAYVDGGLPALQEMAEPASSDRRSSTPVATSPPASLPASPPVMRCFCTANSSPSSASGGTLCAPTAATSARP